jgi:hypothetical protein
MTRTEVQPAGDMSDKQFRKHLEKRHIPAGDFADLKWFHKGTTFSSNRPTHQTYHEYCHAKNPGSYDHVHTTTD